MADKTVTLIAADGSAVPVKYRDNGDGTFTLAAGGGTDNSGAAQKVSLYAKGTVAGDTPLVSVNSGQVVVTQKDSAGNEIERWGGSTAMVDSLGNTTAANTSRPIFNVLASAFNGATWDRWYTNTQGTLLASAARTASTTTADQTNYNARGAAFFLNVTANPGGAETLTVEIQAKDPISSVYHAILDFTATTAAANNDYWYLAYPGASGTAPARTQFVAMALPRTWRVSVNHSSTGSWTYSLSYALIV